MEPSIKSGQSHISKGDGLETYYVKILSLSSSPTGLLLSVKPFAGGSMSDLLTGRSVTTLGGDCPAYWVDLTSVWTAQGDPLGSIDVNGLRGVVTHNPNVVYSASSAKPYPGVTSFAIAASNGALIINANSAHWSIEIGEQNPDAPKVIAVDWLSEKVVIKGCQDGAVRLWDIRSRGESRRFQHPSQINHARRIDDNTIVVAGLESQVRIFITARPKSANSDLSSYALTIRVQTQNHCVNSHSTGIFVSHI